MQISNWSEKSIIYQIYPRSFKDSNNDGIGDIQGIIEKLDYIKELGVDAIWISPMYTSPMKDFGYDVSNYCDLEPMFGTLTDFDQLIEQAHKRDIKVMMDYIPSHTSSQHPWFLESKSSKNNPKRDWYIWKDAKEDGSLPNNWLSVFGGPRWQYDEATKQYYLHTFLIEQPDLNWCNPEVQEAMFNVFRFWLKKGVDGFRVDAFEHMFKDEQFRDEPENPDYIPGEYDPFAAQSHIYTTQQPELYLLLEKFNRVMSEFGNKFMVTESYVALSDLIKLYHAGTKFHAPFNFQFIFLNWNAKVYREFIDTFDAAVGTEYFPTYVLGNHDRSRVVARLGEKAARLAALLQLTLRGIPTIYNGEEIGMDDVSIPQDKAQDPFEKNVPGMGLGRDPERTPMQWATGDYAGFSTTEPWLPIPDSAQIYNVEAESKDDASMLSFYKKLIKYRNASTVICTGSYFSLDSTNEQVLAYVREHEEKKNIILLNFSDKEQKIQLSFEETEVVLNTSMDKKPGVLLSLKDFILQPHEGYLLETK